MNTDQQNVDPNAQQAQPVMQMDPNMIAQMAANAAAAAIHQQRQPDPNAEPDISRMSAAERAEYLKEFNPDDSFISAFATAFRPNDEGQIDAAQAKNVLTSFRDGVTAQAVRTAELMLEQRTRELTQQFMPAVQLARKQQADNIWNEFSSKYPGLAPFRQIVDSVAPTVSVPQGATKEQALELIAQHAEFVLKQANPAFSAKQGFGQQQAAPQFSSPSGGGFTPATVQPGFAPRPAQAQRSSNPFYDNEVFGS
jgi:hypothetical protein